MEYQRLKQPVFSILNWPSLSAFNTEYFVLIEPYLLSTGCIPWCRGLNIRVRGVELGLFGGRLPSGSMSNHKHNIELTAHRFGTECIHGERSRFHTNAVLLGIETASTPKYSLEKGLHEPTHRCFRPSLTSNHGLLISYTWILYWIRNFPILTWFQRDLTIFLSVTG